MVIYESERTKDMLCPKAGQVVTQAPHRKFDPEIDPFRNLLLQFLVQGFQVPSVGGAHPRIRLWATGRVKSESEPTGSSRHHGEWCGVKQPSTVTGNYPLPFPGDRRGWAVLEGLVKMCLTSPNQQWTHLTEKKWIAGCGRLKGKDHI